MRDLELNDQNIVDALREAFEFCFVLFPMGDSLIGQGHISPYTTGTSQVVTVGVNVSNSSYLMELKESSTPVLGQFPQYTHYADDRTGEWGRIGFCLTGQKEILCYGRRPPLYKTEPEELFDKIDAATSNYLKWMTEFKGSYRVHIGRFARSVVSAAIQDNVPVIISGASGSGKTSFLAAILFSIISQFGTVIVVELYPELGVLLSQRRQFASLINLSPEYPSETEYRAVLHAASIIVRTVNPQVVVLQENIGEMTESFFRAVGSAGVCLLTTVHVPADVLIRGNYLTEWGLPRALLISMPGANTIASVEYIEPGVRHFPIFRIQPNAPPVFLQLPKEVAAPRLQDVIAEAYGGK